MKRLFLAIILVLGMTTGSALIAHASVQEKVSLCHLTDSESNPFVVQSVNANEVKSHEANGDFVYAGPTDASKDTEDAWCANHQPGDLCPNIDGKQATLPQGDEVNADGQCVPTPPATTPPVTTTPTVTNVPATPVVPQNFSGKQLI